MEYRQELLRKRDLLPQKRSANYLSEDTDYLDRRQQILDARASGRTYADIATELGLTRQRIAQICTREAPSKQIKPKRREVRIPIIRKYLQEHNMDTYGLYMLLPITVEESYPNFLDMLDGSMFMTGQVRTGLMYLFDLNIKPQDFYYDSVSVNKKVRAKGEKYSKIRDKRIEKYLNKYNITLRTFITDVMGDSDLYNMCYVTLTSDVDADRDMSVLAKVDKYIDDAPITV